ncbi:hypothetical protein PoB_003473300 [Plakobranchus ocellatus]|uniref:Guanylate cyclase domain-containing protein n=1 Tax=Plakobranchus ocellatus TaxID=259542 RepID=A0AAV4ALP1_9GAST|nr:hypothetical protein PoB_003473300 [Plakobranchus ocellatus]
MCTDYSANAILILPFAHVHRVPANALLITLLQMCTDYPANDILVLLNKIFRAIDAHLENHDVYKVETVNDCYMVASAKPLGISLAGAKATLYWPSTVGTSVISVGSDTDQSDH